MVLLVPEHAGRAGNPDDDHYHLANLPEHAASVLHEPRWQRPVAAGRRPGVTCAFLGRTRATGARCVALG